MTTIPNMLPRVQLHAGAYAGLMADVLQARIIADDGTALLLRVVDDGCEWRLVCDSADVRLVDDDSKQEAA